MATQAAGEEAKCVFRQGRGSRHGGSKGGNWVGFAEGAIYTVSSSGEPTWVLKSSGASSRGAVETQDFRAVGGVVSRTFGWRRGCPAEAVAALVEGSWCVCVGGWNTLACFLSCPPTSCYCPLLTGSSRKPGAQGTHGGCL